MRQGYVSTFKIRKTTFNLKSVSLRSRPTLATMHTSLVRLQNVFGFFTTVAFSVAACVAISVMLFPQSPTAELKLRSVQVYVSFRNPTDVVARTSRG